MYGRYEQIRWSDEISWMDENETNRTKLKRTNEMDDWTLNGRLDVKWKIGRNNTVGRFSINKRKQ